MLGPTHKGIRKKTVNQGLYKLVAQGKASVDKEQQPPTFAAVAEE